MDPQDGSLTPPCPPEAIEELKAGVLRTSGTPASCLQLSESGESIGVRATASGESFWIACFSLADKAYTPVSEDPNDHVFAWAVGKSGRAQQLRVDLKSGTILNLDDAGIDVEDLTFSQADGPVENARHYNEGVGEHPYTDFLEDEASPDETDHIQVHAKGSGEVKLAIDTTTGWVLNWRDVKCSELDMSPPGGIEVMLGPGRAFRPKHLEQKGEGSSHKGGHYKPGVAPPKAPAGSKFMGLAPHVGYEQPKARKVGGLRVEHPAHIDAPSQWMVYRHPKELGSTAGQFGLYHPDSLEPAPHGVTSGRVVGDDRDLFTGFTQGPKSAVMLKDLAQEEKWKSEQCIAMASSLPALKARIDKDMAAEGLPPEKLCAAIVLLINRHLFRIGSKIGESREKDAAGKLTGERIETFGITKIRPEHVTISGDTVTFEFPGKAAVPWIRIDSDPRTVAIVKECLKSAEVGKELFRYVDGDGNLRAISDSQVRNYVQQFGFDPHRFRTYYASLRFYQSIVKSSKTLQTAGEEITLGKRSEIIKSAISTAAEVLNDEPATVQKNYILPGLLKAAESGKLEDHYGLKELELAEKPGVFWCENEEDFIRWLFKHWSELESKKAGIRMSEEVCLSGGPWPDLKPGDRWVTLKPNGPDGDSHVHVIIHQTADGGARVVWGGSPALMNLKLNKVGDKASIEKEEKKKNSRVLSPEEQQAFADKAKERKEAKESNDEAFGKAVLSTLGVSGDPNSIMKMIKGGAAAPRNKTELPQNPGENLPLDPEAEKEKEGEEKTRGTGDKPTISGKDAVANDILAEVTGNFKNKDLTGVSPEIAEAWKKAHEDPETAKKIAGLYVQHQQAAAEIRRGEARDMGADRAVRVQNRMAFYDDAEAGELALLNAASNRALYNATSHFWGRVGGTREVDTGEVTQHGLGSGSAEYFREGQKDALAFAMTRLGAKGGADLDLASVALFGAEPIAAAIAASIRAKGPGAVEEAHKTLESEISARQMPTISEALIRASELDEERSKVQEQYELGSLSKAAAALAKTNITIGQYQSVARSAGSLDGAATIADQLRRKDGGGAKINAGAQTEEIVRRLKEFGMEEGGDFELHTDGEKTLISIPEASLPKLLQTANFNSELNAKIGQIKNHDNNTEDFEVPGLVDQIEVQDEHGGTKMVPVEIKPEQQATVRMFLAAKRPLGNLSVGLGKTLTFGIAAQLAKEELQKQGRNGHGHFIVPTNLIYDTATELKKFFPDMDIAIAHGMGQSERAKIYQERHHVTLIGQDVIRLDGDILHDLQKNPETAPGFIFGDEIHTMFTPEPGEKKASQRSKKVKNLQAEYMLAMTGTPFRKSPGEVYKLIDWMNPGSLGSEKGFLERYGKIGRGTSAYGEEQFRQFRLAIDPYSITENDAPKTEHREHEDWIAPSDEQWNMYRAEEAKHQERLKRGAKRGESAAKKVQAQRDILFAAHNNPAIQHATAITNQYASEGRTGIVHCTNVKTAEAYAASMPKGEVVVLTGTVDGAKLTDTRKAAIKAAINNGYPIEGGLCEVGDFKGIVSKVERIKDDKGRISYGKVTMKDDGGQQRTFDFADCKSLVKAVAGTSNVQGLLSTGLNLQKGTSFNLHLQLPDSMATVKQRNARNYRTGQTHDVDSHYLLMDTPAVKAHWRKLQQQGQAMRAVDDPDEYNDPDLMQSMLNAKQEVVKRTPSHLLSHIEDENGNYREAA